MPVVSPIVYQSVPRGKVVPLPVKDFNVDEIMTLHGKYVALAIRLEALERRIKELEA